MPQVKRAANVMLRPNVRECGTVGHYVCEAMGVSATVCADFIDGIIYSLSVSCQSSVMSATKPAYVLGPRVAVLVLNDVFRGRST